MCVREDTSFSRIFVGAAVSLLWGAAPWVAFGTRLSSVRYPSGPIQACRLSAVPTACPPGRGCGQRMKPPPPLLPWGCVSKSLRSRCLRESHCSFTDCSPSWAREQSSPHASSCAEAFAQGLVARPRTGGEGCCAVHVPLSSPPPTLSPF